MGTCLSKKKGSSSSSTTPAETKSASTTHAKPNVTVSKPKVEEEVVVSLKKENEKKHESVVVREEKPQEKKEIFIIKHRKSHDDNNRERKFHHHNADGEVAAPFSSANTEESAESTKGEKVSPPNMGVAAVRTSSCTKEEVDAILIQCGRLSRSSSGKAVSSSIGERGRRYSGSKRSFDFDHCDNDTISTDEDQKKTNTNGSIGLVDDRDKQHQHQHQHRQRNQSPRSSSSRRRTPSREREQQQRSSSRERRISRSPVRRSENNNTTTPSSNASNNSNTNTNSRPGKMVSVPATVTSLVMDKSNNVCGGDGGKEESAMVNGGGVRRITVKRNVGAASPRSQSPARANGNAGNGKVLSENQNQPSLSRNSSRKAEHSPYRRNPLSEVDPNSLAYPQSTTNHNSNRVQNRCKKEIETEANQKPNTNSKVALDKDVKLQSSMIDNIVVKTVVQPGVDNIKPQTLTRSRSSRRSRDLDINPEAIFNPPQSYTSLLLEDIQNFHQKNTTTPPPPSVSLPACVSKACSILEAVADLNSTTNSNFSGAPTYHQSIRNEYNVPLVTNNHYGNKKDPFVESEVVVNDDVMEPSFHKYVTVNRGGSISGVDMEDQESSGSNSFTMSSGGQQHWGGIGSYSSWEPNSADSKDCWTSKSQKSPLGLEDSDRKRLNSKRRECDHQHSSGIGRGRLGANEDLHTMSVVTAAAAST